MTSGVFQPMLLTFFIDQTLTRTVLDGLNQVYKDIAYVSAKHV